MTAMTIVSGSSFPVNSAFATALSRIVRNAFAALTGYRAGPRPDLCATHRPYVRIGTACLRAATFSRYSRAFSTVRPRSCLASSIDFFHAIGRSRPYARAIVSILYSTVYPSFVIRTSLRRRDLRRARRADARAAVDHGLAGHRELAEEMADHLGLDLHRHELLPVVDRDLLSDEVGEDRDVAAVRPDRGVGPVRAEFLDERQALVVEAPDERPARTGRQELDDFLERHGLHLVEGVAAVGELLLSARLHEACALAQLPPCRLRETAAHLLRHAFTSVAASPSAASVSGTSGRPSGREERHIRRSTACRRAGGIRRRGDGRRDSSRPRGPGSRAC